MLLRTRTAQHQGALLALDQVISITNTRASNECSRGFHNHRDTEKVPNLGLLLVESAYKHFHI